MKEDRKHHAYDQDQGTYIRVFLILRTIDREVRVRDGATSRDHLGML